MAESSDRAGRPADREPQTGGDWIADWVASLDDDELTLVLDDLVPPEWARRRAAALASR